MDDPWEWAPCDPPAGVTVLDLGEEPFAGKADGVYVVVEAGGRLLLVDLLSMMLTVFPATGCQPGPRASRQPVSMAPRLGMPPTVGHMWRVPLEHDGPLPREIIWWNAGRVTAVRQVWL